MQNLEIHRQHFELFIWFRFFSWLRLPFYSLLTEFPWSISAAASEESSATEMLSTYPWAVISVAYLNNEGNNLFYPSACGGSFYWQGLTLTPAWIRNHIYLSVGRNYVSIPKLQRLHRWSLGNIWLISSHTFQWMWLIIHAGITFNPSYKKSPWPPATNTVGTIAS